jgi:hypothetical protein
MLSTFGDRDMLSTFGDRDMLSTFGDETKEKRECLLTSAPAGALNISTLSTSHAPWTAGMG